MFSVCHHRHFKEIPGQDRNTVLPTVSQDCFLSTREDKGLKGALSWPSRLFVCLFVGIKPENPYSTSCGWEGSKPPGSGHTRTEAQTATCLPRPKVSGHLEIQTKFKVLAIQCPIKVQSNGSRDRRTRELFIKTAEFTRWGRL